MAANVNKPPFLFPQSNAGHCQSVAEWTYNKVKIIPGGNLTQVHGYIPSLVSCGDPSPLHHSSRRQAEVTINLFIYPPACLTSASGCHGSWDDSGIILAPAQSELLKPTSMNGLEKKEGG